MKVEFLNSFVSDLKKVSDKSYYQKVMKQIVDIENAKRIADIPNIKKIKGKNSAYRIRIGDYRLGFFFDNGIIELARFMHRKDIYKKFP